MLWFRKLNQSSPDDYVPCLIQGDSIPKVLHQTFPTKDLPPRIQANVELIRKQNPDYEWNFYDDKKIVDFISSRYDQRVLDLYLKINPNYGAARADLFRYLCIYQLGGVYLDIKSTTTRPLSSVLRADDRFILAQWSAHRADGRYATWGRHKAVEHIMGGEIQQWHIISVPGHPFLRAAINRVLSNIERYNPFIHGSGRYAVVDTTGPVAYTLAIFPIRNQHPYRQVDIEEDMGIKYDFVFSEAGTTHHGLFRNHYADRIDSVVQVGALWESIYLSMNRAHWRLRAGLRGYRAARILKNLVMRK
jgi:mannosyltransferase OCH1-like enzyme